MFFVIKFRKVVQRLVEFFGEIEGETLREGPRAHREQFDGEIDRDLFAVVCQTLSEFFV